MAEDRSVVAMLSFVGGEAVPLSFYAFRVADVVVVEEGDGFTAGMRDEGVAGDGGAAIAVVEDDTHL